VILSRGMPSSSAIIQCNKSISKNFYSTKSSAKRGMSRLLMAVLIFYFSTLSEAFEPTRTSIATGRGNIFRPSYALGIPRYFFDGYHMPVAKRSIAELQDSDVLRALADNEEAIKNMKRSAALGRSRFRPGKRSVITMEELEDMGTPMGFSLLSEAQMGKRDAAVLLPPLKRSMAVGRSGFRPGKRSIATGRAGFRPGKRSTTFAANAQESEVAEWENDRAQFPELVNER